MPRAHGNEKVRRTRGSHSPVSILSGRRAVGTRLHASTATWQAPRWPRHASLEKRSLPAHFSYQWWPTRRRRSGTAWPARAHRLSPQLLPESPRPPVLMHSGATGRWYPFGFILYGGSGIGAFSLFLARIASWYPPIATQNRAFV